MTEIKAIELVAELRAIRTLSDGTFSVQLVLPEYMLDAVKVMMGWIKDEVHCILEDTTN
jgi:hypothetical protein